jgi:hypothetical protein
MNGAEEYLTVEQLADRLGWSPKTVQNKMGGIFKKGIHYAQAPGLPVLFRWSAILALYDWNTEPSPTPQTSVDKSPRNEALISMTRQYSMK